MVAMAPIFIITLMTSTPLTAILFASSATVMVSPMTTSRFTTAAGLLKPCFMAFGMAILPRLPLRARGLRESRSSSRRVAFFGALAAAAVRRLVSSLRSNSSSAACACLLVVRW
ncbi:hypothetical protein D3C76_948150 [compost metagenome]